MKKKTVKQQDLWWS